MERYDNFLMLSKISPKGNEVYKRIASGELAVIDLPITHQNESLDNYYQRVADVVFAHPESSTAFRRLPSSARTDGNYSETNTILRERYRKARTQGNIARLFTKGKISVGVNIRRGDIVRESQWHHRLLPDSYYCGILNDVSEILGAENLSIVIFTDGERGCYVDENGLQQDWSAHPLLQHSLDIRIHLDESRWLEAFHNMVSADILVTAKSGFSHLAAMLSDGVKLVAPMWEPYDGTSDCLFSDLETQKLDKHSLTNILRQFQ